MSGTDYHGTMHLAADPYNRTVPSLAAPIRSQGADFKHGNSPLLMVMSIYMPLCPFVSDSEEEKFPNLWLSKGFHPSVDSWHIQAYAQPENHPNLLAGVEGSQLHVATAVCLAGPCSSPEP